MRRFVRTFTVARHAQYTVVHDSDRGEFEVLRWLAVDASPVRLTCFPYQLGRPDFMAAARDRAVAWAARASEEAKSERRRGGEAR